MVNDANLEKWIVREGKPLAFEPHNRNSTFRRGRVVFSVL